jgi:hypothetical protein
MWLDLRNIATGCPTKKLDAHQMGPFNVLEGIPWDADVPSTYHLKLPLSWKVHPVFHISLLRPVNINMDLHPLIDDSNLRPPPDVCHGHDGYSFFLSFVLRQSQTLNSL